MKIVIDRAFRKKTCTISHCFVNGSLLCYILEDVVREIPGKPVTEWKVKGATAIPKGIYKVVITESTRFKRPLPLLLDVQGFSGIRIHAGNTSADTEGCLLPGTSMTDSSVGQSRKAFEQLYKLIEDSLAAGDEVLLEVR